MMNTHTARAATILGLLLLGLMPRPAAATGFSAADIDAIAADTLAARGSGLATIPVDPRLRFDECGATLRVDDVRGGLRISCPGSWQVNVRLTSAGAAVRPAAPQGTYLVAVRPILRGAVIRPQDIRPKEGALRPAYVLERDVVIGAAATRTIQPDMPISTAMIKPALRVHRRDPVEIVSNGRGFQVSMAGTARQSGSTGARIEVVNASSHKKISGFVTDSGKIKINR
ncbi:flagellar basal body P-ring formation protein FlgA [Pacificimonas sp. WHA3]|uniref:Flagella basal body P-ring formation protein FlgA n=1 Tax=Pacificimonas pallii TaxID=2827236 RepID=A0ABS6SFI2_9SPHN|nr:flagellar basal body P-ring formation chaperone FlgA [Pacificimonas pallii]MBV7257010.1 flagellar basal body P-ring formation protein FlgA [Pacificimonas pallii]